MEEEGEEASSAITCVPTTEQSPNLFVNQQKETMKLQQNPKKTLGRQKIEIKEIKDKNRRMVTFTKRRDGLFKKAAEISVLCGAHIGIITFSQRGRMYKFGNVETLMERYISKMPVMLRSSYSGGDVAAENGGLMWWERAVESVAEEEMEEYLKALSVLRENLWRRICEMDRTVENVLTYSNPTAMVDLRSVSENLTARNGLSQNRRQ